jgi:trk system potassium uptake protein TrkH
VSAAARRFRVGVEVGAALNLVGGLVKYLSLAFLFPLALALGYSESPWPFVLAGVITFAVGYGLELVTSGKEHVGIREGFPSSR